VPVALVTSANRGIGHEVARQLVDKGYEVIVSARDEQKAGAAADALGGTPLERVLPRRQADRLLGPRYIRPVA
jgi:NAD(P)-dependent dehydrogenase (short-subunit alcohol dehydrogenase family)